MRLDNLATERKAYRAAQLCTQGKANYPDETGVLARAFNEMLEEVHRRDRQLIDANETLERKVTDRTRELKTAMHKAQVANEAKSAFLEKAEIWIARCRRWMALRPVPVYAA